MNLQFYFEKLLSSKEFADFKKENPEAFFCGGFVAIDKESEGAGDKVHLDYFVPSPKQMFSFQLESSCEKLPIEQIPEKIEKMSDNIDFNFKDIEKLLEERMQKENIKQKIQKILLSLQNLEGKHFLVGTIFITGLGMIKVNIDLDKKEITDFQKKSFFDMVNIMKKKDKK